MSDGWTETARELGVTCKHGQLKRQCLLCEYEARIEELEIEAERSDKFIADVCWAMGMPDSSDRDKAIERAEQLRESLELAERLREAIEIALQQDGLILLRYMNGKTKWINHWKTDERAKGE